MAKKSRLDDTAALVANPMGSGESHSVSTRKIENGYLVCESSCNPRTGEYTSSERFSAEEPRIVKPSVRGSSPDAGPSGLRLAMDYVKTP